MTTLRYLRRDARAPRRSTIPGRRAVVAGALGAVALGVLVGQDALSYLVYRGATEPERRARALADLLARGRGASLLEDAIVREEGALHDRALELAAGRDVAAALARRLEKHATLEDLRAAGALADERALPALLGLLRTTVHRPRAAAFTAFAAIVARRGLPPRSLPRLEWSERGILGELARGLEEDSPPWRGDVLRALAARLRVEPLELARARHALHERDSCDGGRALEERCVFWLRGDPIELAGFEDDERAVVGLLAPQGALARRVDAAILDRVLALDGWGGAGEWRWLEAARADLLEAALARAQSPTRPAALGARLLLARSFERPVIDEADEAMPPAQALLGPEDAPALVRAAGRADGRLARVLEPGAGTLRERLLLDLAVAALSRAPPASR